VHHIAPDWGAPSIPAEHLPDKYSYMLLARPALAEEYLVSIYTQVVKISKNGTNS